MKTFFVKFTRSICSHSHIFYKYLILAGELTHSEGGKGGGERGGGWDVF